MKNFDIFLQEIEKALDKKLYSSALLGSLAIPGICAELDEDFKNDLAKNGVKKINDAQKYICWVHWSIPDRMIIKASLFSPPRFDAKMIYELRTYLFHEGKLKVHFCDFKGNDWILRIRQNKQIVDNFKIHFNKKELYDFSTVRNGMCAINNRQREIRVSGIKLCKDLLKAGKDFYLRNKKMKKKIINFSLLKKF